MIEDDPTLSGQPTSMPSGAPELGADTPIATPKDTLSGPTQGVGLGPHAVDVEIEFKAFAERFDSQADINSGGMGRVVRAFDRKLQRVVAVKRLKADLLADSGYWHRFLREARLAAKLNHPNILTVYDIFRDQEGPYLVLEYIEGENLAERLNRGPIPWCQAVDLLLPICDAVIAVHALGVIHRDIKPANILIGKNGVPKLGDFGIARSRDGTEFTQTGSTLGTLDYMAPEQSDNSKTVDERADLYSLAGTLYHMVTGEVPRPIHADELPLEIRTAVMKGLARKPDIRQRRVLDFCQELLSCKETLATSATNIPPVTVRQSNQLPELLISPFDATAARQAQQAWAKHLGTEIELINSLGMKFRLIPPGEFLMGSSPQDIQRTCAFDPSLKPENFNDEQPLHLVRITRPFWLGEHLVTRGQFRAFVRATGYKTEGERDGKGGYGLINKEYKQDRSITWLNPGFEQSDDHPVCEVTWNDATAFMAWLSQNHKLGADYQFPTEAAREYACRAGTTSLFPNGIDPERLVEIANGADETYKGKFPTTMMSSLKKDGYIYTSPVGMFAPSPWGVYDLIGNVWEWSADWYDGDYYIRSPVDDPTGPEEGSNRVIRGGSWGSSAGRCRSASRGGIVPSYRYCYLGFRVCLSSDRA